MPSHRVLAATLVGLGAAWLTTLGALTYRDVRREPFYYGTERWMTGPFIDPLPWTYATAWGECWLFGLAVGSPAGVGYFLWDRRRAQKAAG